MHESIQAGLSSGVAVPHGTGTPGGRCAPPSSRPRLTTEVVRSACAVVTPGLPGSPTTLPMLSMTKVGRSNGGTARVPVRPTPHRQESIELGAVPTNGCGVLRGCAADASCDRRSRIRRLAGRAAQPLGPRPRHLERRGGVAGWSAVVDHQPCEFESVAGSQRGINVGHENLPLAWVIVFSSSPPRPGILPHKTRLPDLRITRPRPTSPVSTAGSGLDGDCAEALGGPG